MWLQHSLDGASPVFPALLEHTERNVVYTTPEWLLENREKRLRLALEERPDPKNEEHLPPVDPVGGNLTADPPLRTAV